MQYNRDLNNNRSIAKCSHFSCVVKNYLLSVDMQTCQPARILCTNHAILSQNTQVRNASWNYAKKINQYKPIPYIYLNYIPQIGQDATTLCLWFCNPPRPAIVLSLTQHPLILHCYFIIHRGVMHCWGTMGSGGVIIKHINVTVMLAYKTLKHVFGNLTRWCISRGISFR